MTAVIFALLIAAVAGITMAAQGTLNAGLGKVIGLLGHPGAYRGSRSILVILLALRFEQAAWPSLKRRRYTYLEGRWTHRHGGSQPAPRRRGQCHHRHYNRPGLPQPC